eukprot:gene11314-1170_t
MADSDADKISKLQSAIDAARLPRQTSARNLQEDLGLPEPPPSIADVMEEHAGRREEAGAEDGRVAGVEEMWHLTRDGEAQTTSHARRALLAWDAMDAACAGVTLLLLRKMSAQIPGAGLQDGFA